MKKYLFKHRLLFLLFTLIISTSCSHSIQKLYDGKEKDKGNVSVIWVDWNTKISEIDGRKVDLNSTWEQYGILPGEHTFTIETSLEESDLQEAKKQGIKVVNKKTVTKNLSAGKCYYVGYHFLYQVSSEEQSQVSTGKKLSEFQTKELLNKYQYEKSIGHNKHAEGNLLAGIMVLPLNNKDQRKIHSYVFDIYDTEKGVVFNKPNLIREKDFWGKKRYHNRCLKIYHGVFTMKKEL